MRHRKRTAKLGRKSEHRELMLANLVSSLILHRRVITTVAKAKAARPFAERLVTLAKKGALHHRRLVASRLRNEDAARVLFREIGPMFRDRPGGYTRIIRLVDQRRGDAAPLAVLEWVTEPYQAKEQAGQPAQAGQTAQ